ncbi:MAG TPA: hypothetical protein VF787_26050 [Thermoanaerobaculia bacterium]
MKHLTILLLAATLAACATGTQSTPPTTTPGRGAITIQIAPNPIVATAVSGDTYDFPFEVIVRETGGRAVDIQRVTATVRGPGGFALGNESWDAAKIRSMGFGLSIPANGELRYRFAPRKSVPDDRLFGSVNAELRVEANDDAGPIPTATTSVTITR